VTGYSGGKKRYGHAVGLPPAPKSLKDFARQRSLKIVESELRSEFYSRIRSDLQSGSYNFEAAKKRYLEKINQSKYTRCLILIPEYLAFNDEYLKLRKSPIIKNLDGDIASIVYCIYSQMTEEEIASNLDDLFLELRDSIIDFYRKEIL